MSSDRLLQDRSREELVNALNSIVMGIRVGSQDEDESDFDLIVSELVYRREHPEQDTTHEN